MDLPEAAEKLRIFKTRYTKQEVIPISADKGEGIEHLKQRLSELATPVGES